MRARVIERLAVAAVAIGLALGTAGATATSSSAPCSPPMGTEGTRDGGATLLRVDPDGDGTSRAGYIVGRLYVGHLPE